MDNLADRARFSTGAREFLLFRKVRRALVLISGALMMGMGLSLPMRNCVVQLSTPNHVVENYNAWSLISTPFMRACRDASEIRGSTSQCSFNSVP